MYMSNVHNMRQRLDSLYRSFEGECSILDSVVSGKEDAYRTVYSPEVERDEAEGRCMTVSVFPCCRILLTADDRANMIAWKEDAQSDCVICYAPVLIKLFMLDAGALNEGEARAEAVSIIRNTMTRLLELLDAGIPIEGWTMFANFAVRRVAGVIDDMQFSTAIARTYYRNILQQLEQSEA